MVIKAFPAVNQADSRGLLAIGGDLEVESLLLAYKSGIFPWPLEDGILAWFAPPRRAILEFDKLHISRSLNKAIRKQDYKITINNSFVDVILECQKLTNRTQGHGTWITDEIVSAYTKLHKLGYAYSIEVWDESELIGGLYGVKLGLYICGESMFYRRPNASKIALCSLVEYFSSQGFSWLDCQVMTPHVKAFGAELISRKLFMTKLRKALS